MKNSRFTLLFAYIYRTYVLLLLLLLTRLRGYVERAAVGQHSNWWLTQAARGQPAPGPTACETGETRGFSSPSSTFDVCRRSRPIDDGDDAALNLALPAELQKSVRRYNTVLTMGKGQG
jgi:hypothetical protein